MAPLIIGRAVSSAVTLTAAGLTYRRLGTEKPAYGLSAAAGVLESIADLLFLYLRPRLRSLAWDDPSVTRLVNRDRSLEELERDRWPAPSGNVTRLVATVHALRRKPIGELTVEDLRLLVRQDVGLADVLPVALEVLRDDPMAEGDMYEGDLLAAVLTRSPEVWSGSPELGRELRLILSELSDLTPFLKQDVERFLAL